MTNLNANGPQRLADLGLGVEDVWRKVGQAW
jgi:hypothetical protein